MAAPERISFSIDFKGSFFRAALHSIEIPVVSFVLYVGCIAVLSITEYLLFESRYCLARDEASGAL